MKKVSSDAFALKQGFFILPFLCHMTVQTFFGKPLLTFSEFSCTESSMARKASSKSGAMTMPRMFSAVREILVDGTEGRKM
jgi:hypothetical protein